MPRLTESKYALGEVRVVIKDLHNEVSPNPNAVLMYSMTITVKKSLLYLLCKRNWKTVLLQMIHTKMQKKKILMGLL